MKNIVSIFKSKYFILIILSIFCFSTFFVINVIVNKKSESVTIPQSFTKASLDDLNTRKDLNDTLILKETNAKNGEFALVPPAGWINSDSTSFDNSFIFMASKIKDVGVDESIVEDLTGNTFKMPNSFIIPLKNTVETEKGDIVLSWSTNSLLMQRAIVINGGENPKVKFLDSDVVDPNDQEEIVLAVNTFTKLENPYDLGTSIVVKKDGKMSQAQVINSSGNKVIAIGFAGILDIFEKEFSIPIPIKPNVRIGEKVLFPYFDELKVGSVQNIDNFSGRVDIVYKSDGENAVESIPFGNVIKESDFETLNN